MAKKRGRKSNAFLAQQTPVKKLKLDFRHSRGHGQVLTVGQGDTGQLGLGEEVMEKTRPGLVEQIKNAVDCVAGGMHTAVLDMKGKVWTFGCNDEGSLGREVAEEEECFVPGMVEVEGVEVTKICSGSDHLVMLGREGQVWTMGNGE